jgi:hypothetical protein
MYKLNGMKVLSRFSRPESIGRVFAVWSKKKRTPMSAREKKHMETWGALTALPQELLLVITFKLGEDPTIISLIHTCKRLQTDILNHVTQHKEKTLTHKFAKKIFSLACASRGYPRLLRWGCEEHGCPLRGKLCEAAGKGGDLDTLKWLLDQGCNWSSKALENGVKSGNLDFIIFAKEKGYWPTPKNISASAVRSKSPEIFQFFRDNFIRFDERALRATVKTHHRPTIEYFLDPLNHRRLDDGIIVKAIQHGSPETLEYLFQKNPENFTKHRWYLLEWVADRKSEIHRFSAFTWGVKRNFLMTDNGWINIGGTGDFELLKFAIEHFPNHEVPTATTKTVAISGNSEMFKFLVSEKKCMCDLGVAKTAARHKNFEIVEWAIFKAGISVDEGLLGLCGEAPELFNEIYPIYGTSHRPEVIVSLILGSCDLTSKKLNSLKIPFIFEEYLKLKTKTPDVIKWIVSQGASLRALTIGDLLESNEADVDFLNFVVLHGARSTQACIQRACKLGDLKILNFPEFYTSNFGSKCYIYAVETGNFDNFEVLEWLYSQGIVIDNAACVAAAKVGDWRALKWFVLKGCPFPELVRRELLKDHPVLREWIRSLNSF